MSIREQLIGEVLIDARWRERANGSTRSREDPRNAAAANACHEIIGYLEGLPADDPRLQRLEPASAGYIRDSDHNEVRAARIGFQGGPPAEPSRWLEVFVASYAGTGAVNSPEEVSR
jgi:hypothetical protein